MSQLATLWGRLNWSQRIWILVAAAAVIGGLSALNSWNQERGFKPLFGNLAAEDAGELVTKLKEAGIDYRLGDGGATVLAPSAQVAEARLAMAAQGLPKSGRIGFELFDQPNFGASDFAEQVNYHRAIEGELERSVMSLREVEQARVHLTMAKASVYTEQRQPAKASVLVKLRPGARLPPQSVAAICQLTASAVPDLAPEQVSLVDTNGTLLNRPAHGASDDSGGGEAALEYRKGIERDVQNKILSTLEPLLGADHFRAGVSADIDLTSGDQSEETYDPQKAVVVTSQKTEDGPALIAAAGVPGTASNLPRPTANAAGASSGSGNYARKTESVSYQTSRVIKHTKLPQGSVRKLSLSVLVDYTLRWDGKKRIVEAPPPEKLKVIRDLVAAATGVDAVRGDQVVVEAFPFESTLTAELLDASPAQPGGPLTSLPLPSWLQKLLDTKNFLVIAGVGAGATFLLLLAGIWFWMRSRKKKKMAAEIRAKALAAAEASKAGQIGFSPEEVEKQIEARMAEQAALQAKSDAEAMMALKMPEVKTKKTDVLTRHIAEETKKNPTLMAQVVRSWLNGEKR